MELTQVRVETFEVLPIPVADSWEKGVVSTITTVVFSCRKGNRDINIKLRLLPDTACMRESDIVIVLRLTDELIFNKVTRELPPCKFQSV